MTMDAAKIRARLPAGPASLAGVLAAALLMAAAVSAGNGAPRLLVLLVLAPLAEETIFRIGLDESLLRRGVRASTACVLAAVAFALAHAFVRGDPAALVVAVPAVCIGLVYGRTRRLRDAVALHAAMNAVWLAGGMLAY